MNFYLKIWRQESAQKKGFFQDIEASDIPAEASFLEMLDIVNNRLIIDGKEPIAFESDCREGICGTCNLVINGIPQGKGKGAACQLYIRQFSEGETLVVEPFRVGAFPLIKDLIVDRSALDRLIRAGGFISARIGSAPDAKTSSISKEKSDTSMDFAACLGCGACAAACPNSAAMLFVGAKITQLSLLPEGEPEQKTRSKNMVYQMKAEGFGNCSNYYACEAVCPAHISAAGIATLNREYLHAEISNMIE